MVILVCYNVGFFLCVFAIISAIITLYILNGGTEHSDITWKKFDGLNNVETNQIKYKLQVTFLLHLFFLRPDTHIFNTMMLMRSNNKYVFFWWSLMVIMWKAQAYYHILFFIYFNLHLHFTWHPNFFEVVCKSYSAQIVFVNRMFQP